MAETYRTKRIQELYGEARKAFDDLPVQDRFLTMEGLKGKFSAEAAKGHIAYLTLYHNINRLVEINELDFPPYATLETILTK